MQSWLVLGAAVLFAGVVAAEEAKPEAKPKAKAAAAAAMPIAADDLKWTEVPDTGGVMSAPLWGDMSKGAYGAMFKFPAGKAMPLHTHSAEYKLIVVSGTFVYGLGDEAQKKYGPGSFVTTAKNAKHSSGCDAGSPCVFYMEQPGKFDMKPVAEKAAAEKAPAKK
jgi:quercetin dioxygenase-like cupin family protein